MSEAPHNRRDEVHRTIRTMSLGTLWRMLRYPFILASMALIPRMMGDTDYGKYAYFISMFVILDMMTDLGFMQVFGRFVPEYDRPGESGRLSVLLHGLSLFGVTLSLLMVAAFALYHAVRPVAGFNAHWVALLSLMLILTRVEGNLFSFLYGLNHIARFSAKEVLRSAATLVLVLGLYWTSGLEGALWGLVGCEIILCVVGAWWTREHLFQPWRRGEVAFIRPLVVFGLSFYLPAMLFGLLQRSGNVFVQHLTHSSEQVAYFDVANQFLLLTATFLGLILQTLLPALTKLHLGNEVGTIERWQGTVMTYCAALAVLSFNALAWMGRPVITALLGESFAPVIPNAWIISIAIVPVLISYAGMNYALLDKKPGVYLAGVALGLAGMAVACVLLVPRLGAAGASWATVLGYALLAAVFLVRYHAIFRRLLRGFAGAILCGGALVPFYRADAGLLDSALWFMVTSVVYAAVLFVFRIVRWSDLRKIRDAFKRRQSRENEA